MSRFREWLARLVGSFWIGRSERELADEMEAHLQMEIDEHVRRGMDPAQARRYSLIRSGGIEAAKEAYRDQRGFPFIDRLRQDLLYTARLLRRSPGFTAVALVTVSLGIGATTAIFTIVNGVLLRPLDYPAPERLMYLTAEFPSLGPNESAISVPEYLEFREMNQSFEAVGGYRTGGVGYTAGEVNLVGGDRPLRVRSISVDAHLLDALGLQPAQGRFFRPEETAHWTGSLPPPIAILSHELWQSVFGGQPIVGAPVHIDGRPHEIIGIMPPGADLMDNRTAIWLPLWVHPNAARQRGFHVLHVIGRLRDGVTPDAAGRELSAFLESWVERTGASGHVPTNHPSAGADHTLRLQPLQDAIVGDARRSIWILQVAVGFVLLIACANLANLLMVRSESRRREFAVRSALGASRHRLLRQTMTEGLVLSVAGGMLGLWLAHAGVRALALAYPTSVPRLIGVGIDQSVLLFALGVSTAMGVLFGLAPAAQRRTRDLPTVLKNGGDRGAGSAGRHRVRRGLVVAEVALAVMLVIGAGLLIRTVYNLASIDAGFDRSRLVTFSVTVPEPYDPDTRAQAYQRLLEKLRAVPGVQGATIMSGLPPNRSPEAIRTPIENYAAPDGSAGEVVNYYQFVMGDYFATLGIPIVVGRGFEPADAASPGGGVVVNETLANRIWQGQNPIGRRLRADLGAAIGLGGNSWLTVIGVAEDVKQGGVRNAAGTELYVSLDHLAMAPPTMNVVLRTPRTAAALSGSIERVVREVDPGVPVVRLRDMDSVFAESIRRPRLLAHLLGAFAGLALLLAAVGTYGVVSCLVTERRREIGIRIALGADRSSVMALVMNEGLRLTLVGITVGILAAFGLNRLIASLLFGVESTDVPTMAIVAATIVVVAAIACWLPAWRASRLDPNVALRS